MNMGQALIKESCNLDGGLESSQSIVLGEKCTITCVLGCKDELYTVILYN